MVTVGHIDWIMVYIRDSAKGSLWKNVFFLNVKWFFLMAGVFSLFYHWLFLNLQVLGGGISAFWVFLTSFSILILAVNPSMYQSERKGKNKSKYTLPETNRLPTKMLPSPKFHLPIIDFSDGFVPAWFQGGLAFRKLYIRTVKVNWPTDRASFLLGRNCISCKLNKSFSVPCRSSKIYGIGNVSSLNLFSRIWKKTFRKMLETSWTPIHFNHSFGHFWTSFFTEFLLLSKSLSFINLNIRTFGSGFPY